MSTSWIRAPAPPGGEYTDIRYEKSCAPDQGIAKITIDRPEVRNAFRPRTIVEISQALEDAREDTEIGVIVLTGEGSEAFCSGGDQRVRGDSGYLSEDAAGKAGVGRFHVTDLHIQIRRLPKPVVAMVAGVCDRRRARAAPRLRSDDRGGQRALRPGRTEGRLLRRRLRRRSAGEPRGAEEGQGDLVPVPAVLRAGRPCEMGMVNTVVPLERLEEETVAVVREMLALSPFALRLLKASFNAAEDGLSGIQQLAHDANLLFYGSEEAQEGRECLPGEAQTGLRRVFPKRA